MADPATERQSEADAGDTPRTADETFAVLADRRRRYLLYHLRAEGGATLAELARRVAATEAAEAVAAVSTAAHRRTYLALYHVHVPFLVERGVVTYDDEHGWVAPDALDGRLLEGVERAVSAEERAASAAARPA